MTSEHKEVALISFHQPNSAHRLCSLFLELQARQPLVDSQPHRLLAHPVLALARHNLRLGAGLELRAHPLLERRAAQVPLAPPLQPLARPRQRLGQVSLLLGLTRHV